MLVKKKALLHGLRPLLLVESPWIDEAERGHFRLWPPPFRSFPFPPYLYSGIPVFPLPARVSFSSACGVPPPAGAMRVRRWFSVSHPPYLYSGISVFPLPARVSFSSACGVPPPAGAMRVRRWFSVSHPPYLYSGIPVFFLSARTAFSSASAVPGVRGVRFRA